MKVYFKGLNSCIQRKQNIEKYRRMLLQEKYCIVNNIEDAQEVWVWSCAFREDVKNNSLNWIKENVIDKWKDKKIVICGCLPDIVPDELKQFLADNKVERYEIIPWKSEKNFWEEMTIQSCDGIFAERELCLDVEKYKMKNPDQPIAFPDQFIKLVISEGCNCDCRYCSERKMFPPYRSFGKEQLIEECKKQFEETKNRNVILVADSLGEYGGDIHSSLPDLISGILEIDENVKIALNNYNPQFIKQHLSFLEECIIKGKIRHINMPIQSASDKVLSLMNRHYTREDLNTIARMFKKYSFKDYDTHIIIGYDGETEKDFNETRDFIVNGGFRYVLASKYMDVSDREEMVNQVSEEEKKRRIRELLIACNKNGIIINCDGSELNKDRMRRISNDRGE